MNRDKYIPSPIYMKDDSKMSFKEEALCFVIGIAIFGFMFCLILLPFYL
jgi:hypothetical protein